MILKLPAPIYEENIVSLAHDHGVLKLTYVDEEQTNRYYSIMFTGVYWYEFTDFEIMALNDWKFGLELVESENSEILNGRLKCILEKRRHYSHYSSLNKLKHYRIVIDDYGVIEVVSRNVEIETLIANL